MRDELALAKVPRNWNINKLILSCWNVGNDPKFNANLLPLPIFDKISIKSGIMQWSNVRVMPRSETIKNCHCFSKFSDKIFSMGIYCGMPNHNFRNCCVKKHENFAAAVISSNFDFRMTCKAVGRSQNRKNLVEKAAWLLFPR